VTPSKGRSGKSGKAAKPSGSRSKPPAAKARKPAVKVSAKTKAPARPARATTKERSPKAAPTPAPARKQPSAAPVTRPSVEITASGARVVPVLNVKRETVGRVELTGRLFTSEPNRALLHEAVTMQLASRRQGTADTKERGEVSGTGRKPWKQKGTGRARAGSVRSPIWRKGGIVFGPTPRSYGYPFPRKKARAALAGAMSAKVIQDEVVVLDQLALPEPKTKLMAGMLAALGLDGSVLIINRDEDGRIRRASANLGRVTVLDVSGLNVYDVLAHRHVLLMQADLGRLAEVWS
jgi:large subunit ribosomal protein L4